MIVDIEQENESPDKLVEKRNEMIDVSPLSLKQTSVKNDSEKE